jgi:hypothetical protein
MAQLSAFTENSFKFSDQKNVRAPHTPDAGGKVDKENLTSWFDSDIWLPLLHVSDVFLPDYNTRFKHQKAP